MSLGCGRGAGQENDALTPRAFFVLEANPPHERYRQTGPVSCSAPRNASGASTRVSRFTSISAGCGWGLLTDRAAHAETVSRSQPQEQRTSQRGFPVLVNGSWAAAASAATSHKPTSRPVALPRPLRVSLLPCLADGVLLGRGERAALERTDQEDSAQNGWQDLPQRSSSQWAQSSVALFDHVIRPL